ncbi:MAG: NAD(P)/FAD-dependent oxidoreductase, partial [Pseudomonadota bacterium]
MDTHSPHGKVSTWLAQFSDALESGDVEAAKALFGETCYWRDLVAMTWNIKTMEGRDAIGNMLSGTLGATHPKNWEIDGDVTEADGTAEAWLRFETDAVRGVGHLRLVDGKALTLLTTAAEIKGHEEPKGANRPQGVNHGAFKERKTYAEERAAEAADLGYKTQPYVVIIGGGQGGIALGARLRRLGVPTIIVEKNERPGDSWRKRYKSLCLHDPVWYDHLPYLQFPDHWPVFAPKDKIGDWLESYTKIMELNYWTSTTAKSAHYDEVAGEWVIEVDREGEPVTLRPKQLVLATGMSGVPNMPDLPGMDSFKGDVHHSSG